MRESWNPLALSDSYKMGHFRHYPPGTQQVYSYFESRGSQPPWHFENTVFFGLQYLLEKIAGPVVTAGAIDRAEERCRAHFGNDRNFNRSGWQHILGAHGGRLPVRVKAVPEGTVVPTHNCLLTIENTDPACYWLTNWLETQLVQVWYPTTVATQSREMKQVLLKYLVESGDPAGIDFKLHDFGCRGSSSMETAAIGGAAHLVSFRGTAIRSPHWNCLPSVTVSPVAGIPFRPANTARSPPGAKRTSSTPCGTCSSSIPRAWWPA